MPSLKSIRTRITSVKNTAQITRAMKLVSAAKLRRAQEAVIRARPYAGSISSVLFELLARMELPVDGPAPHPLLSRRPTIRNIELVVLTSDRGLCGSFNSNVIRRATRFVYESEGTYDSILVSTIGRKGREWARRRKDVALGSQHAGIYGDLRYDRAVEISKELTTQFLARERDAAFLLYTRFRSAISQELVLEQLLPIARPDELSVEGTPTTQVDFKYEPSQQAVLEKLVPQYLTSRVWQALLESVASEQGARMTAMDSATRNAGEMIDRLTLLANRTRQAAITKELMEIVSGAEALK